MRINAEIEEKRSRGVEQTIGVEADSAAVQIQNPESKIQNPVLVFTDSAVKQLQHLRSKKGGQNLGIRVGVKGGGCSGLSYFLKFEESPKANDLIIVIGNAESETLDPKPYTLTVWVDPKSARFIEGTTIDFTLSNFLEGGFKFINPNAAKSCGCGTSFTPKGSG